MSMKQMQHNTKCEGQWQDDLVCVGLTFWPKKTKEKKIQKRNSKKETIYHLFA